MNICLLTSTFLPKVGGLEIVVHNLATALTHRGHNVYVVTPRPNNQKTIDNFPYRVVRIGFKGYGRLKLVTASAVMTIGYVVNRYKIDVINVHNVSKPASWAHSYNRYFKAIPIVGTPHGDDVQTIPEINWGVRLDPDMNNRVERNLKSSTLVTAISQPIFKELQRIGVDPKVIHRIPNGIWTHQFQSTTDRMTTRKELSLPLNSTIAISVGRNHPVKGYLHGIDAIAKLRSCGINISYVIVGRDMSTIVERAKVLGLSDCLFTPGEVESTKIAAYLQAADIFVSTSIVESFSMTTLEAMSAGLPCVVTDSAGVTDLVSPESGLIVDPANSDLLADAIKYLIENPEICQQMGLKAKMAAKKCDWSVVAKAYEDVYRKAIQEKRVLRSDWV